MPDLLTASTVSVSANRGDGAATGPVYEMHCADTHDSATHCRHDAPIATAAIAALSREASLRRWFGSGRRYPFLVEVRDAAGELVLTFAKARQSTFRRSFQIAAHLADGSLVGTGYQGATVAGNAELYDGDRASMAKIPAHTYTQGWHVRQEHGNALASVEFAQLPLREWRKHGGPLRTFDVTFVADAPEPIRALTLAYIVCYDLQLQPRLRR